MKTCNFCGEVKENSLFVTGRRKCKACHSQYLKDRRKKPGVKEKDAITHGWYMRKIRYGITQEEHSALMLEQDNKCAICMEPIKGLGNVDHCHNSEKVRGILCSDCNLAIGQFEDDTDRIRSGINYLLESKEQNV